MTHADGAAHQRARIGHVQAGSGARMTICEHDLDFEVDPCQTPVSYYFGGFATSVAAYCPRKILEAVLTKAEHLERCCRLLSTWGTSFTVPPRQKRVL
jgi:hypothetical protein